jgi:sigma-B regulation protein RsbU (phosphoserine phosphatase)
MRVLIAEYDAVIGPALSRLIRHLGDEPVPASDGEEAWRILQEAPCPAVISAWQMPGCDGLELLRRIRERDGTAAYTYFILLTAESAADAAEHALHCGVDDHLSIPVRKVELMARLAVARRVVALGRDIAERNRALAGANQRMRRDLAAAATAQKALLPTVLPEAPGYHLGWRYQPCEECAGDLLGVVPIDADHLGLYLFDVSGHGVSAALLAVQVARVLPTLVYAAGGGPATPLAVAEGLNATFHQVQSVRFITLIYGLLNVRRHTLELVTCGHPAPLVQRAAGGLEQIERSSHPIAIIPPGQARFATWNETLAPGDRVLFLSDGVIEAPNPDPFSADELFGGERLRAVWRQVRERPFEDALTGVMDGLAEWRGTARTTDDITLLGVERTH